MEHIQDLMTRHYPRARTDVEVTVGPVAVAQEKRSRQRLGSWAERVEEFESTSQVYRTDPVLGVVTTRARLSVSATGLTRSGSPTGPAKYTHRLHGVQRKRRASGLPNVTTRAACVICLGATPTDVGGSVRRLR